MDTLNDFIIEYPHVKVLKPKKDIEFKILHMMCVDTAEVLARHAGREYGFGNHTDALPRATQINLLTVEEREHLPTNNLDAERHLAAFGRRAPVATVSSEIRSSPLKGSVMMLPYFSPRLSETLQTKASIPL